MFSVTVQDHFLVAHSLRGEVFGPAQALHGATYVVEATFQRKDLDPDGIVVDIGLAAGAVREVAASLGFRNLDDDPRFAGRNSTTEVLARYVADRLAEQVTAGSLGPHAGGLDAVAVTLRESPVAWVSYTRPIRGLQGR